jgi:hypothetical protein
VTDDRIIADPRTGEVLDDRHVRPFAELLTVLDGGDVHAEASRALADLTAAVRDTGKKGSLTITVEMSPLKGSSNQLVIAARLGVKLPKTDPGSAVFFIDAAGNLSRNDPRQLELDGLRVVEPKPARTIHVPNASGV